MWFHISQDCGNPERPKQMEKILDFQVPAEGLELVILLHTLMQFYDSRPPVL